ncbi:MAG: type II toxin-antitoxin system VapC family toxin [Calditrichaeota bacterium]|nr:MAG: type II toxin-antitoxin system VapC family toxin [Calditrichota bacterium]
MSGKVLLDTNIIIALFKNDENVISSLKKVSEVFVSNITIGELFFGAEKSFRKEEKINKIEKFIQNIVVLPCNLSTSKVYGKVKNELKQKGNPIPENDILISATAIQNKLQLISRDKHFEKITNLKTTTWQ